LIFYLRRVKPAAAAPDSSTNDASSYDRKIEDELNRFNRKTNGLSHLRSSRQRRSCSDMRSIFRTDNSLESAIIEETEWDLLQRKKEVLLGNIQDLI
jgi:hypothetical protein